MNKREFSQLHYGRLLTGLGEESFWEQQLNVLHHEQQLNEKSVRGGRLVHKGIGPECNPDGTFNVESLDIII